jgi:hypothetical protein
MYSWYTRTHPLASPSLLTQRGGRFSNVIQWSPPSLLSQRRGKEGMSTCSQRIWLTAQCVKFNYKLGFYDYPVKKRIEFESYTLLSVLNIDNILTIWD